MRRCQVPMPNRPGAGAGVRWNWRRPHGEAAACSARDRRLDQASARFGGIIEVEVAAKLCWSNCGIAQAGRGIPWATRAPGECALRKGCLIGAVAGLDDRKPSGPTKHLRLKSSDSEEFSVFSTACCANGGGPEPGGGPTRAFGLICAGGGGHADDQALRRRQQAFGLSLDSLMIFGLVALALNGIVPRSSNQSPIPETEPTLEKKAPPKMELS